MDGPQINTGAHPETPSSEFGWRDCTDIFSPKVQAKDEFLATITTDAPDAQNILVFLESSARDALYHQSEADTSREHGGILLGEPFNDGSGAYYVVVDDVVPAYGTAGSPIHLRFQPNSWQNVWKRLNDRPDLHVIGWYHTHPGLGVFLSGTDMRTQQLHFSQPWHLAVVLDPIRKKIGFFIGKDGSRCTHAVFRRIPVSPGAQPTTEEP
jgi:proteasome lid subunit RPN8/RPN11